MILSFHILPAPSIRSSNIEKLVIKVPVPVVQISLFPRWKDVTTSQRSKIYPCKFYVYWKTDGSFQLKKFDGFFLQLHAKMSKILDCN